MDVLAWCTSQGVPPYCVEWMRGQYILSQESLKEAVTLHSASIPIGLRTHLSQLAEKPVSLVGMIETATGITLNDYDTLVLTTQFRNDAFQLSLLHGIERQQAALALVHQMRQWTKTVTRERLRTQTRYLFDRRIITATSATTLCKIAYYYEGGIKCGVAKITNPTAAKNEFAVSNQVRGPTILHYIDVIEIDARRSASWPQCTA
eukprot:TRINITY_DN5654_c0_g1_i1.p1 TRINITY_DN5654_c0_g1~~TRINITY_DN5654_c0_g1_i1.p1  ORF type:complete len:205 (+),score=24.72 TRINITY_DN5654_c0_g1_i1:209-823(+)